MEYDGDDNFTSIWLTKPKSFWLQNQWKKNATLLR